ncbi:MAG: N-acetylglucosamine-6-phosphate deacetylase [Chloroflexota bacterium]|nr:N-acetylglucosamine-6-phosphate deacetylase [Chloroflexota bacterium]MDE2920579.1 N-acetylglucosamine-6-phosphate deacetylase [Chloroflexota bacterium]
MSTPIHFRHVDVASGGRMLRDRHVLVANGRVTTVSPTPIETPAGALIVNGPGILAQGLVDTHIHGRRGFDVMRPGDVGPLSVEVLKQGVTGFLPTIVATPSNDILASLSAVRGDGCGARVFGVHAEGPFLSPEQPGMFPPDAFRPYDPALWLDMLAAAVSPIRLMTVAAERLARAQIDQLHADGVTLSLGHTGATYEQAAAAFDAGVTRVTHAFNAMTGFHHRAPGAVGALLERGHIDAELILDGLHVAAPPARILAVTRTSGSIVLVSDSVPPAGCPPGDYTWAGRRLRVDGNSIRLSNGRLAGSALTLDAAVRRAVDWLGVEPAAALYMASEAPRASIGLDPGGLRTGSAADLILLDPHLHPRMTLIGGVVRWQRTAT